MAKTIPVESDSSAPVDESKPGDNLTIDDAPLSTLPEEKNTEAFVQPLAPPDVSTSSGAGVPAIFDVDIPPLEGDFNPAPPAPSRENSKPQKSRGAPRKYATPEEAKEAKRLRDAARYNGGQTKPKTPVKTDDYSLDISAEFAAEALLGLLDMARALISKGECAPNEVARLKLINLAIRYIQHTGYEPPVWMMLSINSAAYVAEALNTPTAQSRLDRCVNWCKSKWVARFG